jgi:hypothetical protein
MSKDDLLISRLDLTNLIKEQLAGRWFWDKGNDPRHLPTLARPYYTMPFLKRVHSILDWSQTDGLSRGEVFKCDAFSIALWADFKLYGRKRWLGLKYPYATGIAWSGHAFNWVVTADKKIKFIEPQKDWIMSPGRKEIRPGHWNIWVMTG